MLRELQARFAAALFNDEQDTPAEIAAGSEESRGRFAVYRNNLFVSLTGALANTFPATNRLLGENNFRILARAFIKAHPPARPQLFAYGADFPGFVAEFPPLREHLFMPDLARLEWARQSSYYAEDAPLLSPRDLADVAEDDLPGLTLALHPAACLIRSPYAIHDLSLAVELSDGIAAGAQAVLVTRPGMEVLQFLISRGEAVFIDALAGDATIAGAAEAALAADAGFDLQQTLAGQFQRGTFGR